MLFWLQFIANRTVVEGGIELAKKVGLAVGAAIMEMAEKNMQQKNDQPGTIGTEQGSKTEPPESEGKPPKPQ